MLVVLVSEIPSPTVFEMMPPESFCVAPPSPATVKLPVVLLMLMPLAAPSADTLVSVTPSSIGLPAILTAVALPESIVPVVTSNSPLTLLKAIPAASLEISSKLMASVPELMLTPAPVPLMLVSLTVAVTTLLPLSPVPVVLPMVRPRIVLPVLRSMPLPADVIDGAVPPTTGRVRVSAGSVTPSRVAVMPVAPSPMTTELLFRLSGPV